MKLHYRVLACVARVSVGFGSKELQREISASKRRGRGRFFAPKPHANACYAIKNSIVTSHINIFFFSCHVLGNVK